MTHALDKTDTAAPTPGAGVNSAGAAMAAPAASPSTDDRIPPHVWQLALVIVFGAFMSGLDAAVVNVGLDQIARDLGASLADAQWVANAYLLALGVSLPACGWLGRRIGVGRLWIGALAGFTLSSLLCAVAPTVEALIALRVLQGLTAGLLIPAGQTILGQAVGPQRLGRVMSTLGIAVTAAPAIGPVVGALIIDGASWPWLFLINLPIGIVGVVLGLRLVPRGEPGHAAPLDRAGLVLVSAAIPLFAYGATAFGEARTLADVGVASPLIASLVLGALFVTRSRRHPHAILDLSLFSNRSFVAACTMIGFTGAAFFGAALLLPLFFQLGREESVVSTGLLLLSTGIGSIVALPLAGMLVDRIGGGVVAVAGGLGTILTTLPFALLPLDTADLSLQVLLFLRGVTIALAVSPGMAAAYKAVRREQLPDATVQVNIVMRVGGALGGALVAVVLAAQLPSGAEAAFHVTFAMLTAMSAVGLAAAIWLAATERAVVAAPTDAV